jgi:uncharacterized protein DUF3883
MQTQAKKNRHRFDAAAAGAVLRSIVPDPDALRLIGRLVLDVCQRASDAAPNCWEVTLLPGVLRVNVGQVAVVSINKSWVILCTEPLRTRPKNLQSYWSRRGQAVYAAVPVPSVALRFAHTRTLTLEREIHRALLRFVGQAAAWKSSSPWKRAHSPAVIDFFNSLCSRSVCQPAYWEAGDFKSDDKFELAKGDLSQEDLIPSRDVEEAAIAFVTKRYRDLGYEVRSTEADKIGYDLHCGRRGEVRHVEVKGRALDGNVVILTRGEWERAQRDDRWYLAIVSRANSEMAVLVEWPGAEISKRFRIDPIAFRVALRSDEDDAA